jgi:rhodanese-related sulfurtransferase
VQKFASSLVVAVVALASSVAFACGGQAHSGQTASNAGNGASFAQVVAAQTDKAAPAQKSETTTPATTTAAPAAEKPAEKPAEKTFKMASVDDVQKGLDALTKDKKPFAIFDANGKSTREAQGVIPTAVLLPSSSSYDLALLPKDKATPTVFYCANERCMASHAAAKRALEAGYTDVSVLSAGIAGWVKAGKATDKPVG